MKIFTVLFLFLLISCNKNDPIQPSIQQISEKTYFNGSVKDKNWESDGLAYLNENSVIHIRGFLGTASSHYQIDIVLKNDSSGTFSLDTSVVSASVCDVIGMDAIGATYDPIESSFISVDYDNNSEYVTGSLNYNGFSESYNDTIEIVAEFKLRIGKIISEWTCDFTADGISNCRFTE